MGEDAASFSCPLLGGDTVSTPGPAMISVTAFGRVPAGKMVHRSGARPGDRVVVSGTIGDAALGLDILKGGAVAAALARDAAAREELPLLGVCLGHQAIAQAFGGKVVRAPLPMHGKLSTVRHEGKGIFDGLPSKFDVTRYHSLMVDRSSLPRELEVTAETPDAIIMGLQHVSHPIHGVQFHPESVLTPTGPQMLENFLRSTADAE